MRLSIFCILILLSPGLFSQGFDATIIAGFNASQIDGDDLAGYNKLGLHGGLKVGYLIKPKLHLATELLYSQRGSSSRVSFGSPIEEVSINLNYFEIPVTVSFLDWYVEDSFHKVRADFGLSYGYLFQASSQNSFFEDDVEQFSNNDLSFLAGIGYRFNKKLGINLRYTRSIIPVFNNPDVLVRALYGYFVTFRLEYYL